MIPSIRNQVQSVAVDMPPVEIVQDQELQDFESREERSLARLLIGFGALAFGLAVLGLGTVAYSVSQRMRELAIRFVRSVEDGIRQWEGVFGYEQRWRRWL